MTKVSVAKQGQSDATEWKERGLQAAFKVNIDVFKAKKFDQKYTYWHFDLNCGSGQNEEVGCIGSPLAFLNAAHNADLESYFAGFCDINADSLELLQERKAVKEDARSFLFHGDNASLIEAIPDLIRAKGENPQFAMGMVLSDPNNSDVPFDQLAWLSSVCPRIDFVINWNARLFKLYQAHDWGKDRHTLASAMRMFNKAHWLIRQPQGNWRWTLLIGRGMRINDHRAMGFFHLDSDTGRRIFNDCNNLRANNPDILRMAAAQMAMGF